MTQLTDVPASPRSSPSQLPWPSLPATVSLLASGGDARIAIDAATGRNRYLCPPRPEPDGATFGSSTASTISTTGFAAAAALRLRLERDLAAGTAPDAVYEAGLARLRAELAALCGIADLRGLAIAVGASGTDLHLIAAQLTRGTARRPLVVMIESGETGSGVPAALAGRHFAGVTAQGATVAAGAPVAGRAIDSIAVAIRDATGMPRPAVAIDAEVEATVAAAAEAGRRVLLTVADLSKTGMVAPSPGLALALRARFPERVVLLADACQFRLSSASLRAYLEHGFMVAITGSKFLTGPAFSGALLIPGESAAPFRRRRLAPALGAYALAAELPAGWASRRSVTVGANFGLLLRWEAALAEFRLFSRVPEVTIAVFLDRFARAASARLAGDPAFEPLPVPAIERLPSAAIDAWDRRPTIFPFLLREKRSGRLLARAETERVYADLAALTPRRQLGQPVSGGTRDGQSVAALRLCVSARHVVEAASYRAETVIAQALTTLDAVSELAT
jgi:hypothetical protein